ncbi:MAG: T9SS type A sorting domain-containing protein [Bacteroidia bacterium]
MKRILYFLFTLLICLSGQTKSELNILNPLWGWNREPGEIIETTLAVEPQGLYMKYDLYLTFSAANTFYSPSDSLEVELFFNLPEEAIVCDSWLWIEDYISYGIIMDADSASRTYEGIVQRRTDPSVLFKRAATEYELRIFPITTTEPRKVKITYLLPMEWTDDQLLAQIPIQELAKWMSVPTLDLIWLNDTTTADPVIMEDLSMTFVASNDSAFGNHLKMTINLNQINYNLTLGFDSPMENGVYVSHFPSQANEGYYQMALRPASHIDSLPPEKILFLVDYDSTNGEDFRSLIGKAIQHILSPNDSFNLIFKTYGGITSMGQNWLAFDETMIDSLFDPGLFNMSPHPSIYALLKTGYEFINQHQNEGEIVLFSNNDGYNSSPSSESFYTSLSNEVNLSVPLTVVNYQHRDIEVKWDLNIGRFIWGNDYLFSILAERTGGNYLNLRTDLSSMYFLFRQSILETTGKFEVMDLYTSMGTGFCYDRHEIHNYSSSHFTRGTLIQTGKYFGNFPLEIDFFSIYKQDFQFFNLQIDAADIKLGGSEVQKIWVGKEIQSMDGLHVGADTRANIVELSLENRVLSFHTAFLCLEDSIQWGLVTESGGIPIGIEPGIENPEVNLSAYPNPFVDHIHIQIEHLISSQNSQLQILDIQGRIVHEFSLEEHQAVDGLIELNWNGVDLPAGVYLLRLKTGLENQVIRLLKQ